MHTMVMSLTPAVADTAATIATTWAETTLLFAQAAHQAAQQTCDELSGE